MRIHLPSGEALRQAGHIGAGLGAFLIRPLGNGPVLALVLAALLFNAFVLPRWLGDRLRRAGERGANWGPTWYALSVALLLVAFWWHAEWAVAGWLLLAVGDGAATIVGRRWGKRKLPWNPEKSWAGSVAYCVAGAASVVAALWPFVSEMIAGVPVSTARVVVIVSVGAFAASLTAALVESFSLPLDDNLLPPIVGILVLGGLAEYRALAHRPDLLTGEDLTKLPLVLLIHILLGWIAWRLGAVTRGAAILGAVFGVLFVWAVGWPGWPMFAALPAFGFAATIAGSETKRSKSVAEGRRHAGQVLAKGAAATVCVVLAGAGTSEPWLIIAAVAALSAALADTLASELGVLSRDRPWLLSRRQRVAPGTPGAVSLVGTLAAAVGACVPAVLGLLAGVLTPASGVIATVSGFAAAMLESLVVDRLAVRPDPVAMNFQTTLVAAVLGAITSGHFETLKLQFL